MAEGEAIVEMEAAEEESAFVWAALPKEVVLMVLSHLPIKSLCQLRSVCKEWRDVLHRRDFRVMYDTVNESTEPSPAICYMESSYPARLEWSSYDFASRKWHRMSGFTSRPSLSFNPQQRHTWPHRFYSVGGLLLFHFWKPDKQSGYMLGLNTWVVWHPFRNVWKKLPPCTQKLSDRGTFFVHAWESDAQTKSYKLLVAHDPRSHWDEDAHSKLVTVIYDSATGVWTPGCEYRLRFSEGYESGRHIRTGVLCKNNIIYFSTGSVNCVLLSYNIERDEWHEEARNRNCNAVFEWDGRIMSIAAPESEDFAGDFLQEDYAYVVVERNPSSGRWEDAGIEVPFKVRRKFYSAVAISVVARGNDLVMFGNATDDSFKIAVYKRAENYWRIPSTGTFSDRMRCARVEGLVLHKPQVGGNP